MARARNIKPGLYKNEDLAECSIWARYIFPGLWMLADRDGRLEDRPKRIKGELLPFDSEDVEPLLAELEARKFLIRYVVDGVRYLQISKFAEHQTPHYSEKDSVIPPPSFLETSSHDAGGILGTLQENGAIKSGSQPPDSLIHRFSDSPIPDSPIPDSPIPDTTAKTSTIDPGEACRVMREAGLPIANPAHPKLVAACAMGATAGEFENAARVAVQSRKDFRYAVGIVLKTREEIARGTPRKSTKAEKLATTAANLGSARHAPTPGKGQTYDHQ